MTTVLEIDGADALEQMLNDNYARFRLRPEGGEQRLHLARTVLTDRAAVERVTSSMRFQGDCAPLGFVPIGRVRSGAISYGVGREGTDNRAGDVFLACQPDRDSRLALSDLSGEMVQLDPRLFDQLATPGPGERALRFTGYQPISAAAASRWHHTVDYVLDVLDRGEAGHPLVDEGLARLLASVALTVFPSNARQDPTAEDRHDAHPRTLRRVLAFIDDTAHRGISLADIAAAGHVSIRAVQLAFRRHLNTTPMSYLRAARLAGAHRDLYAATGSVGEIASRWGFADHSRFTATYRTAYGCPPSQTLRRR